MILLVFTLCQALGKKYISSLALAESFQSDRIKHFPPGSFGTKMKKNVWSNSCKPEIQPRQKESNKDLKKRSEDLKKKFNFLTLILWLALL